MKSEQDLHTDTHLSRDFNKVLQMIIIACNKSGWECKSNPHRDLVIPFAAAIETLYINTFFLFMNIQYRKEPLMAVLMHEMQNLNELIENMEYDDQVRVAIAKCTKIQMLIMYGLQERRMLVRMSEPEVKGAETIDHWDTKPGFSKGGLKIPENIKNEIKFFNSKNDSKK